MSRLSSPEFIALIAMMFATVAFSIDAMLPAFPDIGAELSPDAPNDAQLILSSFVLGMGIGTFFTGPLSDAFGRKNVIICGCLILICGAAMAWQSETLQTALAGRFIQGLGAAAPRIVGLAVVRDLYSGRVMARILSIATMVFALVPAVGPLIGSWIIDLSNWRGIFVAFILFAIIVSLWTGVRLPESLARDHRRPFRFHLLRDALIEMYRTPVARLSIYVQCLCMGMLFSLLVLVQPIFDITFDRADSFPYWFGLVALISATGAFVNAALVVRLGMKRMVSWTLRVQVVISAVMLGLELLWPVDDRLFAMFIFYQASLFFLAGTTLGNLQALAMEPLGHISGLVASILGGVSTIVGAVLGASVGQMFDGHIWPLTSAVLIGCSLGALIMVRMLRLPDDPGP